MALKIVEFFGFSPLDPVAKRHVEKRECPFVKKACIKPDHGACSVITPKETQPIICCPNRMYANDFQILKQIAKEVFCIDCNFIGLEYLERIKKNSNKNFIGNEVIMFGRYKAGELSLPTPKGQKKSETSKYYIDWVLAQLDNSGEVKEIVAVEIQTVDTTGNYSDQSKSLFQGIPFKGAKGASSGLSKSNLNWENVNKRILPQLIYKGRALQREDLCKSGLYFVCPIQVMDHILQRLGDNLHDHKPGSGTITFCAYKIDNNAASGLHRSIIPDRRFTTTAEEVGIALTSPRSIPEPNSYAKAVRKALAQP